MPLTTLIYSGPSYEACWLDGPHGGVVVTRKRARDGITYRDLGGLWRDAFASAIDDDERHALCRTLIHERF